MSNIGCMRCGNLNLPQAQFCEKCGAPLPQATAQAKQGNLLKMLGIFGAIILVGGLILGILEGRLENKNKNQTASKPEQASDTSQSNAPQPSEAKQSEESKSTDKAQTTNSAFSDKEYAIYREVTEAPASESEDQVIKRVAKKYQMTPQETKATVQRVMKLLFSGGTAKNQSNEQAIRAAIEPLARIKTVIVNSEFTSIAYIDNSKALNDADVKEKVLAGMPKILEAAFSVPDIRRVRLAAFFPTMGGSESRIASFEADRSEFQAGKPPQAYREFWVR